VPTEGATLGPPPRGPTRVIGPLLPGGGANLRMLKRLGGGSDPPSKGPMTPGADRLPAAIVSAP
jgi:hypothetical protein